MSATQYVIQRRSDGWYVTRFGFSVNRLDAERYDSMTEAELAILSNGLSECRVVPVESDK